MTRMQHNPIFFVADMANGTVMLEVEAATRRRLLQREPEQAGEVDSATRNGLPVVRDGSTAIIPIEGVMYRYGIRAYNEAPVAAITEAVRAATVDEQVDSVLLMINSPGGSVDGLAELVDAVRTAASRKPVIAQVVGMAASAAYMVAAVATEIVSHRMDMIGSIGTRAYLLDTSKFYEEMGIKVIVLTTGEFKATGAPGQVITERQVADMQRLIDAYFADFKRTVAEGRAGRLTPSQLDSVSDGRVFVAHEALQAGLIDAIRTSGDTLQMLRDRQANRARNTAARMKMAACQQALAAKLGT